MVRIRRSHRRGPGSIPGVGTIILNLYYFIKRFHFRLTAVVVFFYCPVEEEDWVTFFCVPTFRNRHFRFKVFSLKKELHGVCLLTVLSVLKRCPSYREFKMTEKRQGPTPAVPLMEVSVKRELTVLIV